MTQKLQEHLQEQLPQLCTALQTDYDSDNYAFWEETLETEQFLDVTVATDGKEWSYQTGDNSFVGGAYLFPHWAVTTVCQETDPAEFTAEVIGQLEELLAEEASAWHL